MRDQRFILRVALFLIVAIAAGGAAASAAGAAWVLKDPRGDDHGDGTLIYPANSDLALGELDLLSFSAEPTDEGTWFEAVFARSIRPPVRAAIDELGNTLDAIAKLGFYTFNIDVYIDTDRQPGSGLTEMLPGRRATVDPSTAWEKAICLTPRPNEARDALDHMLARDAKQNLPKTKGRVRDEDLKLSGEYATQQLAQRYFFPSKVQVVGSKVRFFAPNSFLGGPASDSWAYVIVVSGADLANRLDTRLLFKGSASFDSLMILPVLPGRARGAFGGGHDDDDLQPPLIDIIVPPGASQEKLLSDYDLDKRTPARLPGVVPKDVKP